MTGFWSFPLILYISIFLGIFPSKVFGQEGGGGGGGGRGGGKKPITDYSKLDLNTELLKGSRWSIEQSRKKQMIDVFHAIEIVDISKVDVDTMSVRIEIHLRQRWAADELRFPQNLFLHDDPPETFIAADPKILDSLWSPDSYIPLARDTKIASVTTQQTVVNIFPNKTIVFKARLYTVLGCRFSFQWYPLDKQICSLTIESYTATDDLVSYLWETIQSPVVYSNLKLLQYDLHFPMYRTNGSAERWGRSRRYPFIQLDFEFERQLSHHVIQVFVPTTLIVILSWFSFWLGMDAIPGRISLLITCMLTLVTMLSGLKGSIPPVNYIKMMDIWMVGCIAFVFLALCEFIVVKYLHWKKQLEAKKAEEKARDMKLYLEKVKAIEDGNNIGNIGGRGDKVGDNKHAFNPYLDFYRNMSSEDKIGYHYPRPAWVGGPLGAGYSNGSFPYPQNPNDAKPGKRPYWVIIDRISRVLFPFSFALFNAAFWPWLLIGAAHQVPGD